MMLENLAIIGSLQMPELLLIFGAVLLIFGPAAIPKLARSLGSGIREFKDAATKMSDSVMNENDSSERNAKPAVQPKEVEGVAARSSTPPVGEKHEEKVSTH